MSVHLSGFAFTGETCYLMSLLGQIREVAVWGIHHITITNCAFRFAFSHLPNCGQLLQPKYRRNFTWIFMSPAWKVRRGHLVIGSSIHLSVCLSVRLFVCNSIPLTIKVQYLKFGWWYSNETWTVGSSMGYSHFTEITCPWGWGRVKMLDLYGIFCHIMTLCRRGRPCFTNTCLVFASFPIFSNSSKPSQSIN